MQYKIKIAVLDTDAVPAYSFYVYVFAPIFGSVVINSMFSTA